MAIRTMAALSLAMLPSAALATTYDCAAQQRNYPTNSPVFSVFDNPIQSRMTFDVDEAAGTATVFDPLIQASAGQPVPGNVTENSDKKVTITWEIFARGFGRNQAKMSMRAAIFKNNGKLIVTATPLGYNQTFHARGRCSVRGASS